MSDETARRELLSLTAEIAAQLEYLRELGVSHIAASGSTDQARADVRAPASPPSLVPADAHRSAALTRNAEAEARRAATPPPTTTAAPPRPAGGAPASEQTEMAKRKPVAP